MPHDSALPNERPAFNGRMWREVSYLLLGFPMGVLGFIVTVVGVSLGLGLLITVVGVWVLAGALFLIRGLGVAERGLVRSLLDVDIAEPPRLRDLRRAGDSVWRRPLALLSDGLSWRTALYLLIKLPWGVFGFAIILVALVALWPLLPWIARLLSSVDRLLAAALLSPPPLAERVRELEDDRGAVVDTAAADLRRIERDLHDGAQARLVALAMDLGLAKEKLTEDPETAARMVSDAHGEVKLVLQELRDLARGIHPAVLTDRGLDAALSSVASRCTVPGGARVNADLPGGADRASRPDPAVEGIAYFTVSELLTNVSKHAGARTATVDAWRTGDRLLLQVRDDGRGGADEQPGGGLAGLAERIRAVDGVFVVDSPLGGPTVVTVELPWRTRGATAGRA
ncbi:sensor histidine kinase [Streptacidiphilus sp. P02-A3a]|uniref:sensor histidine kinase n=1 Tax=Streptacidiphilus sp. P02-A3a TaxID=2704468 RepID=UPI0015F819E7|nr:sensor histidine kinase [Streptacidiphilus sp. P02-A3a]QMU72801.1 sensor histidine kinase [Streptacidiphilus sp. P02-A3a]